MIPPVAQPINMSAVAQAAYDETVLVHSPIPVNPEIAGLFARAKSCWFRVSRAQPRVQTIRINQCFPLN